MKYLKLASGDVNLPYSDEIISLLLNLTNVKDQPLNEQFVKFGI
jgi:hypothetical protein